MYPQWDKGHTFESIAELGTLASAFPNQKIYIAETAYPAAGQSQPEKSYPPTPEGQLDYFKALRAALESTLPQAQNLGVLWWEGSECGAWNSLFDKNCVARPIVLKGFQ